MKSRSVLSVVAYRMSSEGKRLIAVCSRNRELGVCNNKL